MNKQLILAMAVLAGVATMVAPAMGQQITPANGGQVTSPRITINNGPGHQTDPHVSGNLASYTDSATTIRYFDFLTSTDSAVPSSGPGERDTLSDVNGSRISFSRFLESDFSTRIFVYDTATSALTEIDPQPGAARFGAALGADTLAYEDLNSGNGDIFVYDLAANPPVPPQLLSTSTDTEDSPGVAPDGNTVVWEKCVGSNCDILKAVRVAGVWTVSTVVSSPSNEENPDTDGTWIVYDSNRSGNSDIFFQPVAGGPERQLALAGEQTNPSISQGVIAFESRLTSSDPGDILVYVIATNTLYQVTSAPSINETLNDVNVLPNGDIRVVWSAQESDYNVYATTFTPASTGGDFTFGPIAPMTITAGGSASTAVTVNPLSGFSAAVNLSVSGQPAGVTVSLSPNSVTPSGGNSASSVLNVILPSFIVPTHFALTVTGTSGSLSHSTTANVTVTATPSSTSNLIGDLLNAGCIDNTGIANALTSKLSAAQATANVQTAINTLTALKNQIQAQAGKHIATSCVIAGAAFNPVTALLLDVQGLIDSLRVSLIPDPITGYVVNSLGVGVPGATVSILNTAGNAIAPATTDITGFYFLATTGVLTPGAYSIAVSGIPAGFASSTPANQAFTWQGTAIALNNFVLN
jgi:Tol biopolymer transport system component